MAGKQIQEVCVVAVFGWELKGQGFVFVGTLIVGFISQQRSVINHRLLYVCSCRRPV